MRCQIGKNGRVKRIESVTVVVNCLEYADQIIALAKKHNIPIDENPALVNILSQLQLGNEIPEALFIAIAEVIAFAYLLTGKQPENYAEKIQEE